MSEQLQRRFTEEEQSLIRNSFGGKEEILKSVRKLFYQLELAERDLNNLIDVKKSKQVKALLRKAILPELDGDAPFFQVMDRWIGLKGLMERTPEGMSPLIEAREKVVEYLGQQLNALEGKEEIKIKFNDFLPSKEKSAEDNMIDLLARDSIINLIEFELHDLKVLSEEKEETKEEREERIKANSSK